MRAGMHVRTTLDANLQNIAEDTVRDSAEILKRANARHAAMVVIDRKTREVLAYVGNVDYFNPDAGAVDMASSPRQTGSAFKPVVYTADMATTGANSGSFILDAPLLISNDPFTGVTYDRQARMILPDKFGIGIGRTSKEIE